MVLVCATNLHVVLAGCFRDKPRDWTGIFRGEPGGRGRAASTWIRCFHRERLSPASAAAVQSCQVSPSSPKPVVCPVPPSLAPPGLSAADTADSRQFYQQRSQIWTLLAVPARGLLPPKMSSFCILEVGTQPPATRRELIREIPREVHLTGVRAICSPLRNP